MISFPLKRTLLVASLVLVALLANASTPAPAYALLGACEGDPVVVLSNLKVIDMSVKIGTPVSDVTRIDYVLHTPPGIKVVLALATPTIGFKGKETFTSIEDAPPDTIITDTIVQTKNNGVPVTARITYGLLKSQTASGLNGQHLINTVNW